MKSIEENLAALVRGDGKDIYVNPRYVVSIEPIDGKEDEMVVIMKGTENFRVKIEREKKPRGE